MTFTRNSAFYPDIFIDAVRGRFKGKSALRGTGAVIVNLSLPSGLRGGDRIKFPYFGTLGELQVTAEDVAVPMGSATQDADEATVLRAGRAFEISTWKTIAESSNDPYGEFASQLVTLKDRAHDAALIDAAHAAGLPASHTQDVYNVGAPVKLQYSHIVDGRAVFGDEQEQIAMLLMHSKPYFDLIKQLDAENRPLLVNPNDGGLIRVAGVPVMASDRCPIDYSGTGAMVALGTAPPVVTSTGSTTLGINQLLVDIVVGGIVGTATFRYSFDGGTTWSSTIATAATVSLLIDNDATKPTGLVVAFAAGTYNADNTYTGVPRFSSAIIKTGALGLWVNPVPSVDTDKDILKDNVVAAIHTYFVTHRWRKAAGGTRPGVAIVKTN